jgi:hypothetical protein
MNIWTKVKFLTAIAYLIYVKELIFMTMEEGKIIKVN